jgi:chromosome partitioning protein
MKIKPARRQIRLAICSNAGGSGKTTLATHLAYAIGKRGYKVTLIELDHNGSLCIFGGLLPVPPEKSLAAVLKKDFQGNYPLIPLWTEYVSTVTAIQGGGALEESYAELYAYDRRHYTLQDRLEDYPLDSDLIIMDTPASLEPMGLLALAACTHVLAPIKPEWKDSGSLASLVDWYYTKVRELRLKPRPQILGFVPSRVDLQEGTHRDILGLDKKGNQRQDIALEQTLSYQIQALDIHCFPQIRESSYYLRASGAGLPLHVYRPSCPFTQDFEPIVKQTIELITA